jgi:hypothetical protein
MLSHHDLAAAASIVHPSLNILDAHVPQEAGGVLTGLVSSFALVPLSSRKDAKQALIRSGLFDKAFPRRFLSVIANYPDCPMHWLLDGEEFSNEEVWGGIEDAKESVLRLFPSQEKHSSRCRMIPIARLLKHGKIMISPDARALVDILPNYSDGMDEQTQKQAESMVRALFMSLHEMLSTPSGWPASFWRTNYGISPCQSSDQRQADQMLNVPARRRIVSGFRRVVGSLRRMVDERRERRRRQSVLADISSALHKLMAAFEATSRQAALDTYELDRDDVMFGLLSRQFHLYHLISLDTRLWIPEYGLVFHRVMADTYILVSWLSKRNDIDLFAHFKKYSLGKQKLYKLHLEEIRLASGFDSMELEDMISERISEEIMEEFLPIELGAAFDKMTIRDMAIEAGLKLLYDIVYSPSSAEIHGEWSSLKEYNLGICRNPLHRLHRLPRLVPEPFLSPGIVLTASSILADTIYRWLSYYGLGHEHSNAVDQFRATIGRLLGEKYVA